MVPSRSGRSSVISIYSPASILDTSLAGTGGSPAPMVTQSSGAGRGGVVTESDRPKVLTPRTEPTRGRLPSAMGKKQQYRRGIYL